MHKMLQITKDFGNTSASKKPGLVKSFPTFVGKAGVRKSIGKSPHGVDALSLTAMVPQLVPHCGTPEAWRSK